MVDNATESTRSRLGLSFAIGGTWALAQCTFTTMTKLQAYWCARESRNENRGRNQKHSNQWSLISHWAFCVYHWLLCNSRELYGKWTIIWRQLQTLDKCCSFNEEKEYKVEIGKTLKCNACSKTWLAHAAYYFSPPRFKGAKAMPLDTIIINDKSTTTVVTLARCCLLR